MHPFKQSSNISLPSQVCQSNEEQRDVSYHTP